MPKLLSIHWGLSLGGVAKYAEMLERVRGIVPVNIRSLCLLRGDRPVDRNALAALDSIVVPVRSVADPTWVGKVRRIVADEAPDCVISHGFNGHLASLVGCAGLPAAQHRLASYHGSYHATTLGRRLLEPFYNGYTHWFLRVKAAGVVSVADYCADFLVRHGVRREKITTVHNGIPDRPASTVDRAAVRGEWGFNADHIVIGVASRLDPVKGLEYLVRAFAQVAQRYSHARLVLMGDGTVRDVLADQTKALGIDGRVLFAGMRSDVPRCLGALDIFALPSLAEYHSIGLLEAMRAGLAIVATDVGGNTESVREGQEGLIVRPADAQGLANALERLVTSPALRTQFGIAARARFLGTFTEQMMLENTAQWLRRMCPR